MGLKGHLVMLHGMTGTSAKMLPLAEEITPSGWSCLCPEDHLSIEWWQGLVAE